jgi:hypothetical protein
MTTNFTGPCVGRIENDVSPLFDFHCCACKRRALLTVAGTGVCVHCAMLVAQIADLAHQHGTCPAGLIERALAAISAGIDTDARLFVGELATVAGRHQQ